MPAAWQKHFAGVRARIRRERSALEWAESHQVVQISPPPLRRKRAFEIWTKSHQRRQEDALIREIKYAKAKITTLRQARQAALPSLSGAPSQRGKSNKSENELPMATTVLLSSSRGGTRKKFKPIPQTLAIIRLIQRGKNYEQINEITGKSIKNIRKIRSRLNNGEYEI
jgi:hypothetical protein